MYLHWFLLFLTVFMHQPIAVQLTASTTCPSFCKCEPGEGGRKVTRKNHTVVASCHIPSNMHRLECASDWDILHLVILNSSPDHDVEIPVPGDLNNVSPSPDLLNSCGSISRLAIWEQSQINTLPLHFLRSILNLKRLVIQVPSLVSLPDRFLAFLPQLNFVKVSNSRNLHQLGRFVFQYCPSSLSTLELNGNPALRKISAGLFEQCDLRVLSLNDNRLERLDWGTLRGLNNLESLRLERNQLSGSLSDSLGYHSEKQSTALAATVLLKRLDLSGNRIDSVEDYQWSGLCDSGQTSHGGLCFLEELNLANNLLEWIGPDAFRGLPQLRRLYLEGNPQLHQLDPSGSLTIALYILGMSSTQLERVSLSVPSDGASPHNRQEVLNVCSPDPALIPRFRRFMREVISTVSRHSCAQPNEKSAAPFKVTTQQSTAVQQALATEQILQTNPSPPNVTRGKVDFIIFHMQNANRFTILLICFGLITFGILMGFFPAICLLCARRTTENRKAFRSNRHFPQHSCQKDGLILNGSTVLQNSPPIMQAGSRIDTPNRIAGRQQPSQDCSPFACSTDQIRMLPLQTGCRERRVNSTGNVYSKLERRLGVRESRQFPDAQMSPRQILPINTRFPQPSLDFRQSPLSGCVVPLPAPLPPIPTHAATHHQGHLGFDQFPLDRRPLLMSSIGTRTDSLYAHTAETQVCGSTYSLATVTSSHRPLSPMERCTPKCAYRGLV
ncbi:Podocan-like protein 1 [Clonorchis sinensis]|uniref:Podocan-like protein 1 n=1 Tax=Clonorchis sinensis TaxID=79923 RepID=A0A419Q2J0_CLOSI|nr:Podocan-like protein 1 [Clonorchis sinensis]